MSLFKAQTSTSNDGSLTNFQFSIREKIITLDPVVVTCSQAENLARNRLHNAVLLSPCRVDSDA